MEPRIEQTNEIRLIGKKMKMSMLNDQTGKLWQQFMPERSKIENTVGEALYAVTIYDGTDYFLKFDPSKEFDKWAAIGVNDHQSVPKGMDSLVIPAGKYAVFHYRGRPSEAGPVFQYIFREWIPNSDYKLDNRPHFALMGANYRGEDPASEEEFWIPVR